MAILLFLVASVASAHPDDKPRGMKTSRDGAKLLALPEEEGVFHFVIFGDRTGGPREGLEVLARAVRDTNLLGPDLVMTVGDMVSGYNRSADWLFQMAEYKTAMGGLDMPWYPVAGNHDIYWRGGVTPPGHHEAHYEKHLGPLWYWFGHKNAAFLILYSDEGDRDSNRKGWGGAKVNRFSREQLEWLTGSLAETRSFDHVFVFLHHPRWITNYYPGSNWGEVHALLKGAGNVSAVFAGHIHRQRYDGKRDGIEYITLATTGGVLPFDVPGSGWLHHMNLVTVRKGRITTATIPVGQVLDPREMTPEHLGEVEQLRGLGPERAARPFSVRMDGSAAGEYGLTLRNPTSRPVELRLEADSADASWWFMPGHAHAVLQPGESKRFSFGYRRAPADGLASLGLPGISIQADYVGETMRVAIPRRMLPGGIRLIGEPPAGTVPDRAFAFDGETANLRVPDAMFALPDGPLTVEAWIKPRLLKGQRSVAAKTQQSEFGLFLAGGKPRFQLFLGDAYTILEPGEALVEAGRWLHLAGVFDGREVRLYVDGRLVARRKAGGRRRPNRLPLFVGAEPDGNARPRSFFDGLIDEVRVSATARYAGPAFEPARRFVPDESTRLLLHADRLIGPFALDAGPARSHPQSGGGVRSVDR